MSEKTIRYSSSNGIAILTLHRPEKLNALTEEMVRELLDVFDVIDADDGVRAVIITGAGRAFCAGADLSSGASTFDVGTPDSPARENCKDNEVAEPPRDWGGILTLRIYRCLKPLIAAINGPAIGIGVTMTLPMDIRLASDKAKIGFVFVRRGIVPEAASSYFLPRVVGISRALEWCYSGRVYPAEEMKNGGLIRAIHAEGELLPAAREIAQEIVENAAPVSIALTRQMMWRGLGVDDPMEAHKIESRAIVSRGRSADAAEGVSSFLEKRHPLFPGRVSQDMPSYFPWWRDRPYC
jgi:enoyl-CoA hydratase/carnithine racemase